jgi:hypothetical protein
MTGIDVFAGVIESFRGDEHGEFFNYCLSSMEFLIQKMDSQVPGAAEYLLSQILANYSHLQDQNVMKP